MKQRTRRCACGEIACIKRSHTWLCERHYRIQSMRHAAKQRGVFVPSLDEMEAAVPLDMKCPHCKVQMVWRRKDGGPQMITLQHDRSGEWRFLCMACNSHHAHHPGDTFYDVPKGHKRCPACQETSPLDNFHKSNAFASGHTPYCRKCMREKRLAQINGLIRNWPDFREYLSRSTSKTTGGLIHA